MNWGEENIAGFVFHLDETNPYAHCTLLPIVEGKFSYKKMFAGKDLYEYQERMRKLHYEFAEVTKKWGFERGTNIQETGAKHRSTEEYRRALSEECTSLEEQIEAGKSLLTQLQSEVAHSEKRVKGLTTMIANLERKQAELEQEIGKLAADLEAGKEDAEVTRNQISSLEKQHLEVVKSLTDKRQKLMDANRKLAEYRDLEERIKEQVKEYQHQASATKERVDRLQANLREAASDFAEQVGYRIAAAQLDEVFSSLREAFPYSDSLPTERLQTFVERSREIAKCAALLFAGYVDGTTNFAQTHGGGNGSDDRSWGRKDDEDAPRWAHRCLIRASQMMRPAPSRRWHR